MLFKDLKTGYNVYILHRSHDVGEDIKVNLGKVTAVSPSRLPQPPNLTTMQMVVDVTIEENGASRTYTIPDSLNITYSGQDLVIATERELLLKEVEAMKSRAETVISEVPLREKEVAQCNKILEEWSPVFKEKRETEERFSKIERSIGDMKDMLSNLVKGLNS